MAQPRSFFKGRAQAYKLFVVIHKTIETLGPTTMEVGKTQISFEVKRKFAWVWLPQMWIKSQPESSVVLSIGLRRKVVDRRIKESVNPYPGRFTHHIVITKAADVDASVKGWLKEAYDAAST